MINRLAGSNPAPSANLSFLNVSACPTIPRVTPFSARVVFPLVSRYIVLSHNKWGNKLGNDKGIGDGAHRQTLGG